MNESKVLEIKPEEKKKPIKPKIESVVPTQIVDVWRLVEKSLQNGGQLYPDTTEDSPEVIRAHLFAYMQSPQFGGLIAKIGKKPVGILLGNIAGRPYGRPSRYAFVWCFWVDEQFRNKGIGKALWGEFSAQMKNIGIHHWEALAEDRLLKSLTKESGNQVMRLRSQIGGRI